MSYNVKFGATDAGFTSTVNKVKGALDGMDKNVKSVSSSVGASFASMAKMGAGIAVGFGAVKLAVSGVRSMIDDFGAALDMGGRLSDLSARTGETAGNLLILERAFQNSGAGADKVGAVINKLQKFMVDAAMGAEENQKALRLLGLSYSQLSELAPIDQMKILAQKLSDIESPTIRSALAMKVFGKSGGELLPVLRNFSNEISNAQSELGSMARIMDAKNQVFDTISDKFEILKGKGVEFAAGILSEIAPALELMTTALSRVDAAGIGERLAKAFVGAQTAMEGFNSALAALKVGEFSLAWETALASVKLQFKQTVNEVYANAMAAISATRELLMTTLGPGSSIFIIFKEVFSILGDQLALSIGKGLKPLVESIPGVGEEIAATMEMNMKRLENSISNSTNRIKNLVDDGEIVADFERAAEAFPKTFKKAYESTQPLFDLKQDLETVNRLQVEVNKTAAGLTFNMMDDVKQLPMFTWNMKDHLLTGAGAIKEAAEKVKETLSLSEQIMKRIKEAQAKDAVDPGGKLEQRAEDAIKRGKFDQAQRFADQVAQREKEKAIQDQLNPEKGFRKSLKDLAKDQGIDTFGKSSKELRKELAERTKQRQEEMNAKKRGEKADPGNNKPAGQDPLVAIKTAVDAIKDLVQKIEPKLPTHALGV